MQYTVGIDLGTTNSVMTWFENGTDDVQFQICPIQQLIAPGVREEVEYLPSFLYQPLEKECESEKINDFKLHGLESQWVSGLYARDRGAEISSRFVSSAKSWLCQPNFDKKKPVLPFNSEDDIEKISPYQAMVQYLKHLAFAWMYKMNCELKDQSVILTVPASFNEEARSLTEEAAREIGLVDLTLLEEPQAALYAWVSAGDLWRKEVSEGDVVLVCDIGGGTSDFSLIKVEEHGGNLHLERTAVGNHILLGGDNMDLAIAYQAKMKIEKEKNKKLSAWQLRSLWCKARQVKELLLSGENENAQLTLLGSGSKLIGGAMKANFSRDEVLQFLTDGFFPECTFEDAPVETSSSGLHELGLSYAADAAITKHIAHFLKNQSTNENFRWPTKILFNGGVFECSSMRQRMTRVINTWLVNKGQNEIVELTHTSLNHAVSRGAAYFGWTKQGHGIKIRAGISRSYYVMVESAMPSIPGFPPPQKAYCIVPFGMGEGEERELDQETFSLSTGVPVRFQFMASTCRQEDQVGESLENWDEDLEPASEMETVLESDQNLVSPVPVRLGARVNDVGVLELFFRHTDSDRQWKLEYSVREP